MSIPITNEGHSSSQNFEQLNVHLLKVISYPAQVVELEFIDPESIIHSKRVLKLLGLLISEEDPVV